MSFLSAVASADKAIVGESDDDDDDDRSIREGAASEVAR